MWFSRRSGGLVSCCHLMMMWSDLSSECVRARWGIDNSIWIEYDDVGGEDQGLALAKGKFCVVVERQVESFKLYICAPFRLADEGREKKQP